MLSTGRVCMFCGGSPVNAEHVWPDWINKVLQANGGLDFTVRHGRSESQGFEDEWSSKGITATVRAVCESCNSGWMSELENEASRILRWLIKGSERSLRGPSRALIGLWAAKTVFVADRTHKILHRAVPEAHPPALLGSDAPPRGLWVFTARVPGEAGVWYRAGRLPGLVPPDLPFESYDYCCTFSVGEMLLQVVGVPPAGPSVALGVGCGIEETQLLWPLVTEDDAFHWPPRDLTPVEREQLAGCWVSTDRAQAMKTPGVPRPGDFLVG